MSGGHYGYIQYKLDDLIEKIDEDLVDEENNLSVVEASCLWQLRHMTSSLKELITEADMWMSGDTDSKVFVSMLEDL